MPLAPISTVISTEHATSKISAPNHPISNLGKHSITTRRSPGTLHQEVPILSASDGDALSWEGIDMGIEQP
ncbi:unnamed protein product [Penicillium camemberti]|uniref:Str. FM013 n=1 Tax=Penicillium camemberti (strain FM 013) TaxID=1429867 RepID=A0A0G4PPW4_PENC3|nr:unnamed protein product [Penicillium camemberti]